MPKKVYTVTLTMPDGTRKYYRGKTKTEAEEKRNRDRLLINRGVDVTDDSTFRDVANMWYDRYVGRKNLHTRSEETIRGILDRNILPVLGSIGIKQLKPYHIDVLLEKTKSMSQSTQKKVLNFTKMIVNFAIDNDMIYKSPIKSEHCVSARPPEEPIPLSDEQCAILLEATEGTRVYPFIVVCLFCGLRKGEALGLMWSDIDFDNHDLNVNRSIVYTVNDRGGLINNDLKTANAKRKIPLPRIVEEVLIIEKKKSNSEYVFSMQDGSYLSESSFRSMWAIIDYRKASTETKRSKLNRTITFEVHPHLLRHTCITRWIESGMDVTDAQRLAGHSSPEITMRIYNHFRDSARYDVLKEKIRRL